MRVQCKAHLEADPVVLNWDTGNLALWLTWGGLGQITSYLRFLKNDSINGVGLESPCSAGCI